MLISLDNEGRKKQLKIIDKLGKEEILSQLSEECFELGHAAQKMRRVLHGTTPVKIDDAILKLEEEIGDVLLLIDCVSLENLADIHLSKLSATRKNERWYNRTFK